jgi:hypothetical protein
MVLEVRKPPHFFSVAHFLSFFLDLRFLHSGASRCDGVVRRQLQGPTGQVPRTDTQDHPYNTGYDCNCVNLGVFLFYPTMLFLTIWLYSADTQHVKATRQRSSILRPMTKSPMIFLVGRRAHCSPSACHCFKLRSADLIHLYRSPALHRTTTKTTSKAGHPRLPHPRIHATSLQAHRSCHSAPSPMVSSTIKPTAHHLPDADYSSPCLGFKAPACTTCKCKLTILIPTGCSPEPLTKTSGVDGELFCSSSNNVLLFLILFNFFFNWRSAC